MLTISDYLKYSNLQMAAEAFLNNEVTNATNYQGDALAAALVQGNQHASRFTPQQATNFANHWMVLDQCANTPTGFSGTLFQCIQDDPTTGAKKGDVVMSLRSTEFIDDSARDNQATNTQEIKELGFAFGQISDMEAWFKTLQTKPEVAGKQISVTGYSLGGHLATAFHILHASDTVGANTSLIKEVVTFNGAGIGSVDPSTTLAAVMHQFDAMRSTDYAANITYQPLKDIYERTRIRVMAGGTISDVDQAELNKILRPADGSASSVDTSTWSQATMLMNALTRIDDQRKNVVYLKSISSGVAGADSRPQQVLDYQIIQEDLDYQMAVLTVSKSTSAASLLAGLLQTYGSKSYGPIFSNQFDIVGDTTPSAVSNSQTHLGFDVRIPIEDQPLYRGGDPGSAAWTSLFNLSIKLLVDKYAYKDFGDTHSLVLIVDSLSVLNTLLQLTPEDKRSTALPTLASIFKSSSYLQKENGALAELDYTQGQGKAEGDVLENLVNSLADLVFGIGTGTRLKPGNPDGGTWAATVNTLGEAAAQTYQFSTRDDLHNLLDAISKSQLFTGGVKGTLIATSSLQQRTVRTDFGAFAALYTLSPFALIGAGSALEGAVGDGWTSIKSEWLADRSLKQSSPDEFDFQISDQWIADRTEMLTRKNWFNNNNLNPVNASAGTSNQSGQGSQTPQTLSPYQIDNVLFVDEITGYKIAQGFSPDSPQISTRRYYFGDSKNNTYSGGMAEDHLYGGGGADVLSGGGDQDYLDGGDGNDLILGGWGADTIKGGTGDNWIFGSSTGLVDAPSSTSFPTPTLSGTELASTVKPETTLAAVMQQFDALRATDYAAHITYQPLKHAVRRFASISSLNAHAALLGSQHALQHQQTQHA